MLIIILIYVIAAGLFASAFYFDDIADFIFELKFEIIIRCFIILSRIFRISVQLLARVKNTSLIFRISVLLLDRVENMCDRIADRIETGGRTGSKL